MKRFWVIAGMSLLLSTAAFAEDAKDISEQFKTITMSITTPAKSNNVPTPPTAPKYDNNPANDDDDGIY